MLINERSQPCVVAWCGPRETREGWMYMCDDHFKMWKERCKGLGQDAWVVGEIKRQNFIREQSEVMVTALWPGW